MLSMCGQLSSQDRTDKKKFAGIIILIRRNGLTANSKCSRLKFMIIILYRKIFLGKNNMAQ